MNRVQPMTPEMRAALEEIETWRQPFFGEIERVEAERDELRAQLAAALDAPIRWRPIAEAPKDGSLLLVAFRFDGNWAYEFAVAEAEGVTLVEFISANPTHFAELKGPDHG